MRKTLCIIIGAVMMMWPAGALAALVGTGSLTESAEAPTQSMTFPNYGDATVYTDYSAEYSINGPDYSGEAYCVEDVAAPPGSGTEIYDYWTIDASLPTLIIPTRYIQATWLANWGISGGSKAVAQLAIWEVVLESSSSDYYLIKDSGGRDEGNLNAYSSANIAAAQNLLDGDFHDALGDDTWDDYAHQWLLAVNPDGQNPIDPLSNYQNYLVPYPAQALPPVDPVPVPPAVFLLGTGLVTLAAAGRRIRHQEEKKDNIV